MRRGAIYLAGFLAAVAPAAGGDPIVPKPCSGDLTGTILARFAAVYGDIAPIEDPDDTCRLWTGGDGSVELGFGRNPERVSVRLELRLDDIGLAFGEALRFFELTGASGEIVVLRARRSGVAASHTLLADWLADGTSGTLELAVIGPGNHQVEVAWTASSAHAPGRLDFEVDKEQAASVVPAALGANPPRSALLGAIDTLPSGGELVFRPVDHRFWYFFD